MARRVERKIPRRASSSTDQTSSEGRRIVIATRPGVVAGGSTICARSPLGREADSSGDPSSIRWRVEFATSFASRRHQSKSANGKVRCSHPLPRLDKRLSGAVDAQFRDLRIAQDRAAAREVELQRGELDAASTADSRVTASVTASAAFATRRSYTGRKSTSRATNTWMRSPWALVTVGGMLIVPLQHLRHDIRRSGWADDHRVAAVLRVDARPVPPRR